MNTAVKTTFLRRELKYIIDTESAERLTELIDGRLSKDAYGVSEISNIYFDTPDMLLMRRSASRPMFKEKLRMRRYISDGALSPVYTEIKRKYSSLVSKRRIETSEEDALRLIGGGREPRTQTEREIAYFSSLYAPLSPTVHISYVRQAYNSDDENLRVTFDRELRCRKAGSSDVGVSLLDDGLVLMEIKSCTAVPMWLAEYLSREKIYCTPFSKYKTAYNRIIEKQNKGACHHGVISNI